MNDRRITPHEIEHNLINLRQLTFEVTDDCNLRCRYCGYGEMYSGYDERKARYMTFEQIRPLMDCLAAMWRSHRPDSKKTADIHQFLRRRAPYEHAVHKAGGGLCRES